MATRSTLPLLLMSCITIDKRAGAALSAGAVAAKEAGLPAASATPVAFAPSATVNEPTVVSAAPAPSVMVERGGGAGDRHRGQRAAGGDGGQRPGGRVPA